VRPLLLVLDDLHAADDPSMLLLRYLARDLRAARLLVVGIYRDVEAARRPGVGDAVGDLVREGQVVSLPGLDRAAVRDLVEELSGVAPSEAKVAAIHEATEGNPLFVREVVRLLALEATGERPGWGGVPIPSSVQAVIGSLAPSTGSAFRIPSRGRWSMTGCRFRCGCSCTGASVRRSNGGMALAQGRTSPSSPGTSARSRPRGRPPRRCSTPAGPASGPWGCARTRRPSSSTSARCMRAGSPIRMRRSAQPQLTEPLSRQALEIARRLDDVGCLVSALHARWMALVGADLWEEGWALAGEVLQLAQATGDRELELFGRVLRAGSALEGGDIRTTVEADVAAHARLAEELRMPVHRWAATTMRAMSALLRGEFEEAERLAGQARSIQPGRPNVEHAYLRQLSLLRWQQGRLGELRGRGRRRGSGLRGSRIR
jgi:hypothetical protein